MRGTGFKSVSSVFELLFETAASLPDVVTYSIGALTVVVVAIQWFSMRPTTGHRSATTATRSRLSPPNPASDSRTNSNTTSEQSTKQIEVQQEGLDTPSNDIILTVSSEIEHQSAVIEQAGISYSNAHGGRTVLDQPADQQSKHQASKPHKSKTQKRSYTTSKQSKRTKYPTKISSNSISLRNLAQKQFIDPIQIETGIDPVSWDHSWGLIKVDFSLTGVSADTGGELFYFNVFPSPISYKSFNSSIELTTTSLTRHLLGTAASSSGTNQQSTVQQPATNKHQHQKTETAQPRADPQIQPSLPSKAPSDSSRYASRSSTQKPTDADPLSSTPTQDSRPLFRSQTDNQESPTADTPGEPDRIEHTQSRPAEDMFGDETTTRAETFDTPWFTTGDTPSNRNWHGTTVEPIFEPSPGTNPSPALEAPVFQSDRQTGSLGESPMEAEKHQQVGSSSITGRGERHSGEVTLNATTPALNPTNPFEDLQQELDVIGIDSPQFGFHTSEKDRDLSPDSAPIEPVNNLFDVTEAAERLDAEPLFPEVELNEPLDQEPDTIEGLQEPIFDTEFRL